VDESSARRMCSHEALVANARKLKLIYAEGARPTGLTPRSWRARLGRLVGRCGWDRPGLEGIRREESPEEGEARQQGLEAGPVPLCLQLPLPPCAQRGLLQEEEGRGQRPPPGRDRTRPTEGQRPLGDAPRRRNLPRAACSNGLTNASGCIAVAVCTVVDPFARCPTLRNKRQRSRHPMRQHRTGYVPEVQYHCTPL
jgi:hypothetical protein